MHRFEFPPHPPTSAPEIPGCGGTSKRAQPIALRPLQDPQPQRKHQPHFGIGQRGRQQLLDPPHSVANGVGMYLQRLRGRADVAEAVQVSPQRIGQHRILGTQVAYPRIDQPLVGTDQGDNLVEQDGGSRLGQRCHLPDRNRVSLSAVKHAVYLSARRCDPGQTGEQKTREFATQANAEIPAWWKDAETKTEDTDK